MSRIGSMVSELRRRRVFRVAGLYIVGAWVALQVFDLAFASWGLPETTLRFVWVAVIVFFPLALVFGWRFDITPNGIVRTPPASGSEDLGLKPADYAVLIGLLAVLITSGWFLAGRISDEPPAQAMVDIPQPNIDPLSIAVLPFATRSNVDDTAYFADGIHDDLLTTLSKVSALKVISRTSVLEYRETNKNIREIGRELGAANVLEGGVQQAGNNVRINVQLIDAETDEHIWAHTFDRELSIENIFAIQSEIVETIAAQLAATLSPEERVRIRRDRTDNLEAFREFTRGKQDMSLASFKGLNDAVTHFESAIRLDPEYVLAHAALANSYASMASTGAISVSEMIAKGRGHIDTAVELNADNGFVQAVLARYAAAEGDPAAESLFLRALDLAPNDVDVLNIYATHLRTARRSEEALPILERALDLDPLSVLLYHDLGRVNLWMGNFEPALAAFRRIAQINPGNPYAAHGAGMATILSGQLAEAGYWSDKAAQMDSADYENPSTSVFIYVSAGNMEMAERRLIDALELGPEEPYPLSAKAYFLLHTGERDKAIDIAKASLAMGLDDRWGSDMVFLRLVANDALATGRYEEALAWFEQKVPELVGELPQVNSTNILKAVDLGHLLLATGSEGRARHLLETVVATFDAEYTLGSANFPLGISKVEALALLGRHDEALSELRRLVDDGWRVNWQFHGLMTHHLDAIRDRTEFKSIMADIETDLQKQHREFDPSSL
ncbi:MAG: tetratricopeptide repeat protein [Gammaproteobacteria bacterium]|nr:tetratricopeptide repeat protein [Gammaproteobacteria bacterium]